MTTSLQCARVGCGKPVSYDRPLCYPHWREFDRFRLFAAVQDTWVVLTPSGNTNFHCRADLPLAVTPPDRAVRVTGLGCNTQGGFTTNHKKVFTPSGKIHLVCQINGSN